MPVLLWLLLYRKARWSGQLCVPHRARSVDRHPVLVPTSRAVPWWADHTSTTVPSAATTEPCSCCRRTRCIGAPWQFSSPGARRRARSPVSALRKPRRVKAPGIELVLIYQVLRGAGELVEALDFFRTTPMATGAAAGSSGRQRGWAIVAAISVVSAQLDPSGEEQTPCMLAAEPPGRVRAKPIWRWPEADLNAVPPLKTQPSQAKEWRQPASSPIL